MERRGAIHVDWAVSMSLFLIFVIGVLVLFRPGILPSADGSFLTEIVEEEFVKNVSVRVEKVPFTIITPDDTTPWTHARVEFAGKDVPFCDAITGHYLLLYADGLFVPQEQYKINAQPANVLCNAEGVPLNSARLVVVLSRDLVSSAEEYQFILVHAYEDVPGGTGSSCGASASVFCQNVDSLTQGVRVVQKGLSAGRIDTFLGLVNDEYELMKEVLHFPESNDFQMCRGLAINASTCYPQIAIPDDVQVFSHSVSGAVINSTTGELIGREDVVIRAW